MLLQLDRYAVAGADAIITPALLIYPALVEANIAATIAMAAGNPDRWRPHMKTAKIPAVLRMLLAQGVRTLKCSTTLELHVACEAGFPDVLLAFPVMGANAVSVLESAALFPDTQISVLIESAAQATQWLGKNIGIFIDINTGMNRTGLQEGANEIISWLAEMAGSQFRGLHYYDGHLKAASHEEREQESHAGYRRLLHLIEGLAGQGIPVGEIITSGTPAAPFALSFSGFEDAPFIHRISPGTVVYNDLTSLEQLPDFGYRPAALVLTTVVSHPTERIITSDAGHKSVSVDAGVPNCSALGSEHLHPLKPSEEHLPFESVTGENLPALGDKLYLIPKHVCPTINNFDQALFVRDGQVESIETVSARGHERPLQFA